MPKKRPAVIKEKYEKRIATIDPGYKAYCDGCNLAIGVYPNGKPYGAGLVNFQRKCRAFRPQVSDPEVDCILQADSFRTSELSRSSGF